MAPQRAVLIVSLNTFGAEVSEAQVSSLSRSLIRILGLHRRWPALAVVGDRGASVARSHRSLDFLLLLGACLAQLHVVWAPWSRVAVGLAGAADCAGLAGEAPGCRDIAEALLLRVGRTVLDRAILSLSLRRHAPNRIVLVSIYLQHQFIVALLEDHVRLFDRAVLNLDLLEDGARIVVLA